MIPITIPTFNQTQCIGIIAEEYTVPETHIKVQRCIEISPAKVELGSIDVTQTKCIFTTPEGLTIVTEPTIDKKCIQIREDKVIIEKSKGILEK